MYNILKFYPIEHRNLKSMNKDSKLYKKELLKFMQRFNMVDMLMHLTEEDKGYDLKKQYLKCIKFTTIWFFIFLAINIFENVANEARGVFSWTNTEILHFIRYMIEFCFSLAITMFYAFKARGTLKKYLSFLIQNTPIKCPHLSNDEVLKLLNIFESKIEYMDTKFRFACINCLDKFSYEVGISQKINGDYTIVQQCPKCNSEYIFYYGDDPSNEFLNDLHEFWIEDNNDNEKDN